MTVDPSSDAPFSPTGLTKREKLVHDLEILARAGDAHERFPSENDLAERFQLSADTVRKALDTLERRRLIYRKRRSGTFISPRTFTGRILVVTNRPLKRTEREGKHGLWVHDEVEMMLTLLEALDEKGDGWEVSFASATPEFEREIPDLKLRYPDLQGVFFFRAGALLSRCRKALEETGFPFVFYGSDAYDGELSDVPGVRVDEGQVTRLALDHLWSLGHRRIAVAFTKHPTLLARKDRFVEWMKEKDLPVDSEALIDLSGDASGEGLVYRMARAKGDLTALFSTGDELVAKALQDFHGLSIQVPRDLSVISVNNSPVCELLRPTLTSIDLPIDRDCIETRALLVRLMSGGRIPAQPKRSLPRLIQRDSTGPARKEAP